MNRMCLTLRQLSIVVTVLMTIAVPSLVWAQTQNASIVGVLSDSGGNVISNATVTVTSPALQVPSLTTTTDSQGAYKFVDLPAPGVYRITFEAKGFRGSVNDGINLGVGFTAKIDGTLSVGSVTDKVEVTTAGPVVDTISTASSATLQKLEIQDTPKGLGLTELLPMAAGVSYQGKPDVGDSNLATTTTAVTFGAVLQPSLQVEGINLLTGKSSDSHIYLQSTALAEVEFKTSGNNADVGLPGVAQIAVMKSGGNTFHGDLQADYQPPQFQGNNITAALAAPPNNLTVGNPLEGPGYYDYSADLGGRIITNKLWFYGGYAGQYVKAGQVNFVAAPNAAGCWTCADSIPGTVVTALTEYNYKISYQVKPNIRVLYSDMHGTKFLSQTISRLPPFLFQPASMNINPEARGMEKRSIRVAAVFSSMDPLDLEAMRRNTSLNLPATSENMVTRTEAPSPVRPVKKN